MTSVFDFDAAEERMAADVRSLPPLEPGTTIRIPHLTDTIRCDGHLPDDRLCGKLLAKGAIIHGSIELACPKCGKRTVIASAP